MKEIINMIESAGGIVLIIGIVVIAIRIMLLFAILETSNNTKKNNELMKELIEKQETTNKYLYTIAENQVEMYKIIKGDVHEEQKEINKENPSTDLNNAAPDCAPPPCCP